MKVMRESIEPDQGHTDTGSRPAPQRILSVCAWCLTEGLKIEAPGHVISHGICERHAREMAQDIAALEPR